MFAEQKGENNNVPFDVRLIIQTVWSKVM